MGAGVLIVFLFAFLISLMAIYVAYKDLKAKKRACKILTEVKPGFKLNR